MTAEHHCSRYFKALKIYYNLLFKFKSNSVSKGRKSLSSLNLFFHFFEFMFSQNEEYKNLRILRVETKYESFFIV